MARCRGAVTFREARDIKVWEAGTRTRSGGKWEASTYVRLKKSSQPLQRQERIFLLRVVYDSLHIMAGYISSHHPNADTGGTTRSLTS